jgi:hypothetical protein
MGAEAICTVRLGGRTVEGKVRLETDVLQFRGADIRLSIPFKQMSNVSGHDGALSVTFAEGTACFALGAAAKKWAHKILHPPSRLDKLGVKPGQRIAIVNIEDGDLAREIASRGGMVSVGRASRDSDAIFYGASRERDLARLERLKASLAPAGALWVIRPKGRPEISERAVMAAGKAAGLVDVKVVGYSRTHTAEKFVIPVAKRGRSRGKTMRHV